MRIDDNFAEGFDLVKAMEKFRDNPTEQGKRQFFKELKDAQLLVPYQGDTMNVAATTLLRSILFMACFPTQNPFFTSSVFSIAT